MSWLVGAATSPLVLGCSVTLLALYLAMALAPETAGLLLPFVFANAFTTHFFIWFVHTGLAGRPLHSTPTQPNHNAKPPHPRITGRC